MTNLQAIELLASLHDRGFDRSKVVSETDPDGTETGGYNVAVNCWKCEAMVINGTATHETGCPNGRREPEMDDCDDGDYIAARFEDREFDTELEHDLQAEVEDMEEPMDLEDRLDGLL